MLTDSALNRPKQLGGWAGDARLNLAREGVKRYMNYQIKNDQNKKTFLCFCLWGEALEQAECGAQAMSKHEAVQNTI